jgi:error-prone DNA polymerase
MTPAYAELRCKTNFTFLRGASHPEELVAKAKELGLSALGICDFASVGGAVRAHVAAQGAGLPIVVGAEVAPRESPPLILLAKSRTGYGALCRMLTRGRRSAPKGQCYLSAADVAAHAGELLCIAAPGLEDFDGGALESRLAALRHAFGLDLYLSVEQHFRQLDFDLGAWIDEVSRRLGIPLVATHDVQFHEKRRKPLHDVLCAIREGTSVAAAGSFLLPNDEFALRAPLEQWNIFERWLGRRGAEAVERTTELVSKCHFSLGELRYEYPSEVVPGGHTPESWLRTVTFEGAAARYPAGVPEKVRGLIEHELALVHEMQYEPYFLTVFDIVRYARSKSILCQGRGSAANSAICYCLGVTAVDPATTELLFERFISKERNEPPDIDIDFEHERREEVIQYVYDKYGRERAGIAAEVICYRGRSAVRDVGKALGLSLDQVDRLAKTLDHYDTADVSAAQLEEAGIAAGDAAVRHVIRFASEITDFPRHLSQHVGGFVISRGLLSELVPIENAAMSGRTVVEWDKNDLDALGLIKVDLLALGMLTATRKAFDLISMHHGVSHGLATIPKEEPETYEMLCHADAVGVFQVESRAQRSMLQRLKPRHFYDLVVEIAIVRPGPIQGQMVHPYLRRRSGEEKYDLNEFPALRPLVERTFGVPLFQEQVMRIAIVGAGFSAGEADRLRRAMGAWKKRGVLDGF